jgi:NADPH:quinone reductase-like Zn-dependent oxidoreductase
MRALQFGEFGALSNLTHVELTHAPLSKGELRVRICAAGVNPSDVKNVLGKFPYTTLPRTPGRDFSGVVVEGASAFFGREVWGSGAELGFTRDGSHGEFMVVPETGVAFKPQSLTHEQAASCGVPYVTALAALDQTGVRSGQSLVILGVGAVGRAALALARLRGAKVVCAVRRSNQAERLALQGESVLVLADPRDLAGQVQSFFPAGPDVIFDTTGQWLPPAIAAVSKFGKVAVIAAPSDGHVNVPVLQLYRRGASIVGVNSLLYDTAACAHMLEALGKLFDAGQLPLPEAPRRASLSGALEVYRELNEGCTDKIVVCPD